MPLASITTSYNNCIKEIGILSLYMNDCGNLESKYQYFISEVIMLRLFSILETTIGEVALKLCTGALYKNGNAPIRHVACRSINDAYIKMLNYGRGTRPLQYLQWTSLVSIQKCILYTLDTADKFFINIQNNISLIDEMRDVRNHIAHRNSKTAAKYHIQLNNIYGGNLKISLGAFLTSTLRNNPSNIERYLRSVPIILDDITKG